MRYLFLLLALASTGCGHRRAYTSGHPQPVDTDSGEYRVLQTHEGDYATFYCHVRDSSTVCNPYNSVREGEPLYPEMFPDALAESVTAPGPLASAIRILR